MKPIYLTVALGFLLNPLLAQVQFSIVCNQQTYRLEVVVSGKEQPYHQILKDRFPNQAAAEAYMQSNVSSLSCQDPTKPTPKPSTTAPSGPPPTTAGNPSATSSNRNRGPSLPELKYRSTRLGVLTFQPEYLRVYDTYNLTVTKIPTFYFASGSEVAKNFDLSFEMLFNYRRFDTDRNVNGVIYGTRTDSYLLSAGVQGVYRIPGPLKIIVPYPQASVGYMHNFLSNEETASNYQDSYKFGFGSFYWKLGGGVILQLGETFGFFLEGGYFWNRSIKTLGQIAETILDDRGVQNPKDYIPTVPPFTQVVEGSNPYFNVGLLFRVAYR